MLKHINCERYIFMHAYPPKFTSVKVFSQFLPSVAPYDKLPILKVEDALMPLILSVWPRGCLTEGVQIPANLA